jgi:CubicO group peptidase (beta-lactamase class C family)
MVKLRYLCLFTATMICCLFLTYTNSAFSHAADPPQAKTNAKLDAVPNLNEALEQIRQKHQVPALAAAVVKDGHITSLSAVGVRRTDKQDPVEANDSFHIGSCTKAMTATLCAILVQKGKLKWDSTIGEVLADQKNKIHVDLQKVTLEQLLMHRSGLPEDRVPDATFLQIRALTGPMLKQRRQLVEIVLSKKPPEAPGAKFQYSNAGYTVAGAMCERATGKTWETLMRDELFKPLGMTTAGFGPPATRTKTKQPSGHIESGGKLTPMPAGPFADNPAVIGPAGTVHCSLADWAKFANFHLRGENGQESILPKEAFEKLHTPLAGDNQHYAFGWLVAERPWAGGKVLTHSGSNGLWKAVIWMAPNRDAAYLAATNVGNETSSKACDEAVSMLIRKASETKKTN